MNDVARTTRELFPSTGGRVWSIEQSAAMLVDGKTRPAPDATTRRDIEVRAVYRITRGAWSGLTMRLVRTSRAAGWLQFDLEAKADEIRSNLPGADRIDFVELAPLFTARDAVTVNEGARP